MAETRMYGGKTGEERRRERRAKLIAAAMDLLAEGGSASLTVTGTCERAKLSERYFYESFSDRSALLDAIFDEVAGAARGVVQRAAGTDGSPWDRARLLVAGFVDIMLSDPRLTQFSRYAETDQALMYWRSMTAHRVGRTVEEHAGAFWPTDHPEPSPVRVASVLVIGTVADMVVAWHTDRLRLPLEVMLDRAASVFLAVGQSLAGGGPGGRGAAGQSVAAGDA